MRVDLAPNGLHFGLQDAFFVITSFITSFIALISLHHCPSPQATSDPNEEYKRSTTILNTRLSALTSGALTLWIPSMVSHGNPLVECVLRIVYFFFAAKIFDLAFTRADRPPVLVNGDKDASPIKYAWLLLTETRYHSFDIAVKPRGRDGSRSDAWSYISPVVIPLIVFIFPTAETKSLLVLLIINLGLELSHTLLHPSCLDTLFWRPFSAASLTSFWNTHWHAGAESFLRQLGYVPAKNLMLSLGAGKKTARAAGVIGAFNVSGIWHGWATAALATRSWMIGLRIWSLFIAMGVGCIVENAMPAGYRGSHLNRVMAWSAVLLYAGWCWRGLQSNCKVPWLAEI